MGMLLTASGEAILPRVQRVMSELTSWGKWSRESARSADACGVPSAVLNGRRLEMFSLLTQCHHMPTVAREMGVSQPAVSVALAMLEACAQQPLFKRTAKGLFPTDRAKILGESTRRALHEAALIEGDIAAANGLMTGEVVIGVLPLARAQIVPAAIAQLLARNPGVRVSTVESPFEALCAEVRAGDVDFIVGALRDADYAPDLQSAALFSEPMAIVVRRDHPLAKNPPTGLDQLANEQWIVPRRNSPARALLWTAFTEQGVAPPDISVETGDAAIIRGLLLQTNFLAALSLNQMYREVASGEVVVLPIELKGSSREIGITQRAGAKPSAAAAELMRFVRACAKPASGDKAITSDNAIR
jgi:LysR family transcriptional regulator of gallate degradation